MLQVCKSLSSVFKFQPKNHQSVKVRNPRALEQLTQRWRWDCSLGEFMGVICGVVGIPVGLAVELLGSCGISLSLAVKDLAKLYGVWWDRFQWDWVLLGLRKRCWQYRWLVGLVVLLGVVLGKNQFPRTKQGLCRDWVNQPYSLVIFKSMRKQVSYARTSGASQARCVSQGLGQRHAFVRTRPIFKCFKKEPMNRDSLAVLTQDDSV